MHELMSPTFLFQEVGSIYLLQQGKLVLAIDYEYLCKLATCKLVLKDRVGDIFAKCKLILLTIDCNMLFEELCTTSSTISH